MESVERNQFRISEASILLVGGADISNWAGFYPSQLCTVGYNMIIRTNQTPLNTAVKLNGILINFQFL